MDLNLHTLRVLLASPHDQQAQAKVLQYFDYLTQTYSGWEHSARILLTEDSNRYAEADDFQQNQVHQFIKQWILHQAQRRGAVSTRNKSAQIVALAFLVDFPARWPAFFQDLAGGTLVSAGTPAALDFYLRVLHTINCEIADKDISHTPQLLPDDEMWLVFQELVRNTLIKDSMRDHCVRDLVSSWLTIVKVWWSQQTMWPSLESDVVNLCLDVVGSYVAWIDIGLVANDDFVTTLLSLLARTEFREAAADCLREIIAKGMDPRAKATLVESFLEKLTQVGAFQVIKNEEDSEYVVKLSRLMNVMGTSLVEGYNKILKSGGNNNNTELLALTHQCINNKVPYLLAFLNSESEDVSLAIVDFARDYILFLKQQNALGRYGQHEKSNVESLLNVIFSRYKYDDFYNFNDQRVMMQGEGEAVFDEYRKTLKVLFDNLSQLDKELVLMETGKLISNNLSRWKALEFSEVEVALAFLYLLGESLPPDASKSGPLAPLLRLRLSIAALYYIVVEHQDGVVQAVSSGVVNHGHMAISREYFELVLRYEKVLEPDLLLDVLAAFLDERGLAHPNPKVRSRVSYLFSRFIRAQKSHIQLYISHILLKVQEMLEKNFSNDSFLCFNDQLNLYEAAAQLIIGATSLDPIGKHQKLDGLLRPVIVEFKACLQRLQVQTDEQTKRDMAELMNHAIEITCKTSKAFSGQNPMKACACTQIYLDSLSVFLTALQVGQLGPHTGLVQTGVRKLLHRLVVCLEEELLPYISPAAFWVLAGDLPELVPLLNQIIAKYKKDIVPFIQGIFTPFVQRIFEVLTRPVEANDQEAQREKLLLQRNYYAFIAAIVTNNVVEAITDKVLVAEMLKHVLLSIVQGAVEIPDPVVRNLHHSFVQSDSRDCTGTEDLFFHPQDTGGLLGRVVWVAGGNDGVPEFLEFIYQSIIPACFMAPLKESFDLTDAQTAKLPNQLAAEFCDNLVNNPKDFKFYLKVAHQEKKCFLFRNIVSVKLKM
ncbi:XPOT [Cordylochernes scorpioides]|uniref:Exportin-T n=1 Tax=Cordylochernes scorpioides TaxID=51811 RepID=A0ABY6K1I7_9ARAC|nr:XPOT [Cordylochernes scorpioides]